MVHSESNWEEEPKALNSSLYISPESTARPRGTEQGCVKCGGTSLFLLNSNTIELTVHTFCYLGLGLTLCYYFCIHINKRYVNENIYYIV